METMFRMRTIAIIVATVFIMVGCAAKKKKSTYGGGPAKLYAKGLARFNGEKHQKALEIFKDVKSYYPESPEAVRAEIRTADCHFFLAEYEEAIAIYEEFRKLHPYHEDIPYVLFQIGQANPLMPTQSCGARISGRHLLLQERKIPGCGLAIRDIPSGVCRCRIGAKGALLSWHVLSESAPPR